MAPRRDGRGFYGFSNSAGGYSPYYGVPLNQSYVYAWYKGDSLEGFYFNHLAAITTLYDFSGNGNNGTVGTSAATLISNGIAGRAVMSFTGHNGYKIASSALGMRRGAYFVVWSRDGTANSDVVLLTSSSVYSYLQYAGNWYCYNGGIQAVAHPQNTFMLKCATYDGITVSRYTNGAAHTPVASTSFMSISYINSLSLNLNGDIAEMIILRKCPSESMRLEIEDYLNQKYVLW